MAAIVYTRKAFIQRIQKHLSNSRVVSDQFAASANEILLLIDQAAASRMIGQIYQGAKMSGFLEVPEAYLITYPLPTLIQDPATNYWYSTLPQPPMALPLGYSVNRVYPKSAAFGAMKDAYFIKAKRVSRMLSGVIQPGVRCWFEGNTIWLAAHDNAPLDRYVWNAQMISARTTDVNAVMNMPEDDVEFVFADVVKTLAQRYGFPQDIILDGLPAGNKTS